MNFIEKITNFYGKTVFMRADFDVPIRQAHGKPVIAEPFRIEKQRETLHHLLDHSAKVVLVSHISAVPSFEPLKPQLEELLKVSFGDTVTLLENTRQNPGEKTNDESFARELVAGCDLYVNNAFAVCHREHASVVAAAKLLPAYAGFLVKEETEQLSKIIDMPKEGKIIFIGGAKAETKMPVVEYLLDKAETIAIGGKVALEMSHTTDQRIHMPVDFVYSSPDASVGASAALDIGPKTAQAFAELAERAQLVVWNGPMGKFEDSRYAAGTEIVARAIAASNAFTIVGGGDTIAAVNQFGLLNKFGFVSTGGGAMLSFLAGQKLPGLDALGYYD